MSRKLDYKIKKIEKGPLQRFKNQNAVLKKFGEQGLRLYKAGDGKKTADEIVAKLGVETDFAAEVIAWLEENGMITLIQVEGETAEITTEKEKEPISRERKISEIKKEEEKAAPRAEFEFEEEKTGKEKRKISETKKEEEIPETRAEEPVQEHIEENEEEIIISKPKSRLRELIERDETEKILEEGGEEPVRESAEEKEEISPEDEIKPFSEEEEEKETGKEQHFEFEEEKPHEEMRKISEIGQEEKPEFEDLETGKEERKISETKKEEEKEITPESSEERNPIEKTIIEKYGEIGLKVYALIDGQKNAEEIMTETGVSEKTLIEMLEFMEKQGIIKLEHPEVKTTGAEGKSAAFAPLTEETSVVHIKDTDPVEMPSKLSTNLIKNIQIKAKIALKYGEKGSKIFDAIDGKITDIELSIKFTIPLYEVRDILSFLLSAGAIIMKPLDRAQITKRYGEDCFTVYKKYGREGILLYELIGKDMGIKKIANLITTEKDKFIEMFIFAHKVLGIDIPIEREVIYAQLERKK